MAEHCGYIVKIRELRPIPKADRIQVAVIFGASVIVSIDTEIDDIGVYFPIDLQLSEEYCAKNNLVRKKDAAGNNTGGYLDPDKRNIRAMKLRGEQSEGLYMPLESLAYTGITKFEVGETITTLNGHEICRKYIPKSASSGVTSAGNHTRKHTVPIAPLFAEHADTEQLVYHMKDIHVGDQIEITLKMHGTSGRTGFLPKLQGYRRTILDRLLRRPGTPIYDYGYVTGTRRTVINDFGAQGGFYGDNLFREPHARIFEGKLWKGETVFYEIVGFTHTGRPIMGSVSNSKIADKAFSKQYGKRTVFSYGCDPDCADGKPQSDMYVYRMTMTTPDGQVVEYTPDFMRYRCEQMGVKCVPSFWKGYVPDSNLAPGDFVKAQAEQFYDGPDPVGRAHIREGVVIRVVNAPKFRAFKHKNFSFKVLEGLAKDAATAPDMEEAQELIPEE